MPRLVKGGKYVYGWSVVGEGGAMRVPGEALLEYGFGPGERLVLLPGSRRSGGFSASTLGKLESTVFFERLRVSPVFGYGSGEGEAVVVDGRSFCWVTLDAGGCIRVPLETLRGFSVGPGDWLLAARGSHVGIGFPVRGPVVEEARRHEGLECFTV